MSSAQPLLLTVALLSAAAGCDQTTETPKKAEKTPSEVSRAEGLSGQEALIRLEPRVRSQYAILAITPSHTKVQASMMGGTGSHLIPGGSDLDSLRRDHVASFDISEGEDGALTLSTSEPDDELWLEMESLTSLKAIVPSGAGSTYRFHGIVSRFFPGYVFQADSAAPMVFILTADAGLKFLSGRGKVILPNREVVVLHSGQ